MDTKSASMVWWHRVYPLCKPSLALISTCNFNKDNLPHLRYELIKIELQLDYIAYPPECYEAHTYLQNCITRLGESVEGLLVGNPHWARANLAEAQDKFYELDQELKRLQLTPFFNKERQTQVAITA